MDSIKFDDKLASKIIADYKQMVEYANYLLPYSNNWRFFLTKIPGVGIYHGVPGTIWYRVIYLIYFNEVLVAIYTKDIKKADKAYKVLRDYINTIYYCDGIYQRLYQNMNYHVLRLIESNNQINK